MQVTSLNTPYRAVVVFIDGSDRSCPVSDEHHAARFFDQQAMIVGHDKIVATYVDNERNL